MVCRHRRAGRIRRTPRERVVRGALQTGPVVGVRRDPGIGLGALPVPSQTTAPAVTFPSATAAHRTVWAPDASMITDSVRAAGVPSSGSAHAHNIARSSA
jgi:hypothetical protein